MPTTASASWAGARSAALASSWLGSPGYLATVTSAGENSFIFGLLGGQGDRFWLGGTDEDAEGTFRWKDGPEAGQTFVYQNFAPGQPDNFVNEDYVEIFSITVPCCGAAQWNDLPNAGASNGYVIEYNAAAIPEPRTFALLAAGLAGSVLLRRNSRK